MRFNFSEQYRLEIHWADLNYLDDKTIELKGCYICGPVLNKVESLNYKDSMRLDFFDQYIVFLNDFYVSTFSWSGVTYKEDRIELENVKLTNKYINSVPKLDNKAYIVVDTSSHDTDRMVKGDDYNKTYTYSINYRAYLIKEDNSIYNFNG